MNRFALCIVAVLLVGFGSAFLQAQDPVSEIPKRTTEFKSSLGKTKEKLAAKNFHNPAKRAEFEKTVAELKEKTADLATFVAAGALGYALRNIVAYFTLAEPPLSTESFTLPWFCKLFCIPLIYISAFAYDALYTVHLPYWEVLNHQLKPLLLALFLVLTYLKSREAALNCAMHH